MFPPVLQIIEPIQEPAADATKGLIRKTGKKIKKLCFLRFFQLSEIHPGWIIACGINVNHHGYGENTQKGV
jgi:hypothetical protein